jgi:hypothetical protein
MMKVTVLYGIPASPEQFEKYYGGRRDHDRRHGRRHWMNGMAPVGPGLAAMGGGLFVVGSGRTAGWVCALTLAVKGCRPRCA